MVRFVLPLVCIATLCVLSFLIHVQSHDVMANQSTASFLDRSDTPIFAPGRVEGATLEIELRPEATGAVVELNVEEGQQVKSGAVLLRLNAEQYASELLLAEADLARAEAEKRLLVQGARDEERREAEAIYHWKLSDLELAQLSRQRARALVERRAMSHQQMDDREAAVKSLAAQVVAAKMHAELLYAPPREDELAMAEARIAAAHARLRKSRALLHETELRAPIDGQILRLDVEIGEHAGPDSPTPAILIADMRRQFVRAFVEELDAPRIQPGMQAIITADGIPGQQFTGRVVRVSPRMTAKGLWTDDPAERYDTKTREALIQLPAVEDLVVGLRVDVAISPSKTKEIDGPTIRHLFHKSKTP